MFSCNAYQIIHDDGNYMEYHGDLVRHSLLKYWYEVGTKFDDCGTKFYKLGRTYNPEVIE